MEREPQESQQPPELNLKPQSSEGLELLEVDLTYEPSDTTVQDEAQLTVVDSTVVDSPSVVLPEPTALYSPKFSPDTPLPWMQLETEALAVVPFLQRVFLAYPAPPSKGSCVCGVNYGNNCAHHLTNYMALAGAVFPAGVAKCPAGRMIRAKETLLWFRQFATGFQPNHNSITGGIWFVYQEFGGQGHVCLHWETPTSWSYRGTGDYPAWPTQWHYFY
jgi:hypothetical protein